MDRHRPRKRFGQHFLHDANVIRRIVASVAPQRDEHLVEIGPGRGAITRGLAAQCARLDLVEIDRDLAAALEREFAEAKHVHVHNADALRFDFACVESARRCRVVGNLPYNISTPLLFHFLDHLGEIEDLHLMLQREVVERMAARPGTPDYGRLSVGVQLKCEVRRLFNVAPGAFNPPPKVHSSVVWLRPLARAPVEVDDPGRMSRIVAQAFSQRRKTLRNSLRGLVDEARMSQCGIDPSRRPETLSLAEFAALANTPEPVSR